MTRNFRRSALQCAVGLVVVFALALAGCAKKDDISGTWQGKIILPETGKALSDLKFTLNRKGKEVTGVMIFTKPGSKLPLTGSIVDGKLSLTSPMQNGLAVSISADCESPHLIRGTAVLDYAIPQEGKKQDRTRVELTR